MYINEKYLFVFSSSYHGYYIEELLRRNKIKNTLRKAPRAVARSCHTAVYILEQDLDRAVELVRETKLKPQGIYEILWIDGVATYKKLDG